MRKQILGVSSLLGSKTFLSATDFRDVVFDATEKDLIYMDPPYQGTSSTRDHRYYDGLDFDELTDALETMNDKRISYIVSYDGQTGEKSHGRYLPAELSLVRLEIRTGRSSQATLLGTNRQTVESLYLSPALINRLGAQNPEVEYASEIRQKEFTLV